MIARRVVIIGFVTMFCFTAICFSDQDAWVTAAMYVVPTCIYCLKKVEKELGEKTDVEVLENS